MRRLTLFPRLPPNASSPGPSHGLSPARCCVYTVTVKIALAQINPTVGDFTGNADKLRQFAASALSRGAELVVFPELSVCGYPPRDLVELPAFVSRSRQVLEELAAGLPDLAIIAGFLRPPPPRPARP